MKKIRKFVVVLVSFSALLYILSVISGKDYIWKTLVYNYVDYDDYKIFSNRTIPASNPEPLKETDGGVRAIPEDVDAYFTEMQTIGLLAIKKGKVVHEKYWPGYDEQTIANSFSVAKSYISMLVGFAIDDGYIDGLDDGVRKYLPELPKDVFDNITLRHLITMTSGLEWIERYNMPINHTSESYYGTDLWKLVSNLAKSHKPGEQFHYKGSDPQLLAFVLEKVTGQKVSDYLSKKFWIPTGHNGDGLWSLDHDEGMEKAYCCINTTARNFSRIGTLFLNHGRWNGKELLDSTWCAQSVKSHLIPNKKGEPTDYYGYMWWNLNDQGKNIYYCRGLNGQYVVVFPDKDLVIVRIGHKREASGRHPNDLLKLVAWGESL